MTKTKKAFLNGKIYTQNNVEKWAESIITFENKILFVGSNSEAQQLIDAQTELIDLEGKLVLPGFIESHAHIILGGFYLLGVDLEPCKTTTEFVNTLKNYVPQNKSGWIKGGNWNHQNWEVNDFYPCSSKYYDGSGYG